MEGQISDLILSKSNKYVIANKPVGISSQVNLDDEKSIQELLEIYSKHRLYIISRLDRPVSGLILFAQNDKSAKILTELQRAREIHKTYYALVEKLPTKSSDRLEHFMSRNVKGRKAIVNAVEQKSNKKAILEYECLHSFENYHLLRIKTLTGRFHQIRAQLAFIGCPIKGDVKYGARRSNKDRSIHLHCQSFKFIDPFTKENVHIKAPFPSSDGLWIAVADLEIFK